MKKNISINLQGLIFHIEEDGYEVLGRYLAEVKAHFASFRGHQDIVADLEGRIAELFAARLSPAKQVITLEDVEAMMAKMGRVSDFAPDLDEEEDEAAGALGGPAPAAASGPEPAAGPAEPRRLFRDMAHRKIAGVAAGLAQYFAVNPLWVRLGFVALFLFKPALHIGRSFDFDSTGNLSGFAVLAYVVLWILLPKRYDAPDPETIAPGSGPLAGRRLFRDTDTGKIGGVAAGLAAYFNVDVVLVRVLLVAGLFAGGFTFLLYLILWVVVPEAKTVSEKLEMRGDAITLKGFASQLNDFAQGAPQAARTVGTFLEGAARSASPAVGFLGTLIRWAVGGLLIFIGGSLLFSLFTALGVVAGLLPSASLVNNGGGFHFDDGGNAQNVAAVLHNVQPWAAAVALLAAGIPVLALVLLGLRLLLRRSVLGRTASLSLLGLWLVGVVGTAAAAGQLIREFRTRSSVVTTRQLAPVPGRGLVLAMRDEDDNDYFENVRLRIAPADSGKAPFIEQEVQARGLTAAAARQLAASSVHYNIEQKDSVLTLDRGFTLTNDAPYRDQRLTLTLHLPLDKNYRLTPVFIDRLRDSDFEGPRPSGDDQPHRARLLPSGRFQCLDCPNVPADDNANDGDQSTDRNNDGDDSNSGDEGSKISLNFGGDRPLAPISDDMGHYGSGRKTLDNAASFTEIEASGDYRVLVRQGDSFAVQAAGTDADLRNLRLEVSGSRLVVKRRDRDSFMSSLNFNRRPVLVRVTMPALHALDLSGACRADVAGFRDAPLKLDASGACTARLDVNVPRLVLDLNGACAADLRGQAQELSVDGSGACRVEALDLRTDRASFDLGGMSQARVQVSNELKAELSGSSRVRYRGTPRVTQDLSGSSNIEQL